MHGVYTCPNKEDVLAHICLKGHVQAHTKLQIGTRTHADCRRCVHREKHMSGKHWHHRQDMQDALRVTRHLPPTCRTHTTRRDSRTDQTISHMYTYAFHSQVLTPSSHITISLPVILVEGAVPTYNTRQTHDFLITVHSLLPSVAWGRGNSYLQPYKRGGGQLCI